MRETVFDYIKTKYKVFPEYPWAKYDSNAVFRHKDNQKWFALVMNVRKEKLGLTGEGCVDVINLKIDDGMFRDVLVRAGGVFPAYHMNKQHWVSVLLDGTVNRDRVYDLIDMSFAATAAKNRKAGSEAGSQSIYTQESWDKEPAGLGEDAGKCLFRLSETILQE